MGGLLNCCQRDNADKKSEVTIEKPVNEKAAPPEKTPDASSSSHPELFGSTDWTALFSAMKDNAEAGGKEISVRVSRRDPEGSHANQFYMSEQIYAQATEEKEKSNSIDLHVIRVKEALELTQARFDEIKADLESGSL